MSEGPPIEFLSAATTAAGAGAFAKPSGVAEGDYVFIIYEGDQGDGNASEGPTTWGRREVAYGAGTVDGNKSTYLAWKKMAAADVSGSWGTPPASGAVALRYASHGADTVSVKSTFAKGGGTTTLTLTGFTKAANTYGVLAFFTDHTLAAADTEPAGFVSRANVGLTIVAVGGADCLSDYVDGASVQWTNVGSPAQAAAILIEVTGP